MITVYNTLLKRFEAFSLLDTVDYPRQSQYTLNRIQLTVYVVLCPLV
jgi:hypothetical protein